MEFSKVIFWIHILNVPLAYLNNSCAKFWGNEIGELLVVEINGVDMKVRAMIDVTQPLKYGIQFL